VHPSGIGALDGRLWTNGEGAGGGPGVRISDAPPPQIGAGSTLRRGGMEGAYLPAVAAIAVGRRGRHPELRQRTDGPSQPSRSTIGGAPNALAIEEKNQEKTTQDPNNHSPGRIRITKQV